MYIQARHTSIDVDGPRIEVFGEVTRIEVGPIEVPGPDDEFPRYFRRIRFLSRNGEALEIQCEGENEVQLQLNEVEKLTKLKPVSPDEIWIRPRVYKPEK